jgi:hypothetical protein
MVGCDPGPAQSIAPHPARITRRMTLALIATLALAVTVPAIADAAGTGFQWKAGQAFLPVTKSTAAEWTGKLKITDSESVSGQISVECTDKVTASVGVSGTGEITGVSTSECVGGGVGAGKCSSTSPSSITAVNLPWKTELAKVGGTPREAIVNGGKGTPGLHLHCKVLGLQEDDTCTGSLNPTLSALEKVAMAFNKGDTLTCTLSEHSGTGYAEGSQTIAGVGIEEGTPIWGSVSKEETRTWSGGTITLHDQPNGPNGAPWGVTCKESGEGTVAPEGKGSITHLTLSSCEQSAPSECNGADSLEALHLPWKTQLYFGRVEAFGNAITQGGSGAVAFKVRCETHGLKEEDTCEAGTQTEGRLAEVLTNSGGVIAKLYEPSEGVHLTCHRGGENNSEVVGSRTLPGSVSG